MLMKRGNSETHTHVQREHSLKIVMMLSQAKEAPEAKTET